MRGLMILRNVLLVVLIIGIVAMAITTICKSRAYSKEIDSYCKYLDDKYGWTWED